MKYFLIFDFSLNSWLVIIIDTWLHNGRPLFLSLIRHYTENGFFIRYFKYDSFLSSEKSSMEHFNLSLQEFIVDGSRNESMTCLEKDWTCESHRDSVIIAIDSLTPLLLNWGISHVANALRNALKTSKTSTIQTWKLTRMLLYISSNYCRNIISNFLDSWWCPW